MEPFVLPKAEFREGGCTELGVINGDVECVVEILQL